MALPIPELAPVIKATFPDNFIISILQLLALLSDNKDFWSARVIFARFYKEKGKWKTYLVGQTKGIEAHRHYGTSKDIEDSTVKTITR